MTFNSNFSNGNSYDTPPYSLPPVLPTKNTLMSRGKYIALISALVASGFFLVFIASAFVSDPTFSKMFTGTSSVAMLIASIAGLIVGLFVQYRGTKTDSIPLCLVGFYLISIVLGILTAIVLPMYDLDTITAAFGGTIVIAIVFGLLGFAFPNFFAKIHGILVVGLLAMIVVEILFLILGVSQGWTDWVVLIIFCGFIGYDFYQAVHVPTTKINAVLYATEIYLDLLNVFLRLLSIFGNRD